MNYAEKLHAALDNLGLGLSTGVKATLFEEIEPIIKESYRAGREASSYAGRIYRSSP